MNNKLSDTVRKKFERLRKLYERIDYCDIKMIKEKSSIQENSLVEAKLHVPRKVLFAKAKAENFEVAAEMVVKALEVQVAAYQEKLDEPR